MIPYRLSWMADCLREAGLKVEEVPGWKTRGRGDVKQTRGVLCHHTAGPKGHGNMPSLDTVTRGRSDLPGPLCNLALGRDGTFYVVAAGKANHAGRGLWEGVSDGNRQLIGIEAENTGYLNHESPMYEEWPEEQYNAYVRGVSALLGHIKAKPIMAAGHKEYALPHGRKPDPTFDMKKFREDVSKCTGASSPSSVPTTVPSV